VNVSLTAELVAFVEEVVRRGRYGSASEAVREGLRLLQEREAKFQALKRDIEEGLASGPDRAFDQALAEQVKARGRAKLAARHAAE